MHEGAEVENNRKMEEYGPGRQRWKINQRNIKSRQTYMIERRYPWLEEVYAISEEN
jgi:hypothetical protein